MKSNYKNIGEYIKQVDVRNLGLRVQKLVGLSISKEFIPSVANIIGTDMENYKIIKRNQFACSTMQVRRDKKMPVALFQEDEAIISQAYPVFEVKDENKLLPEYLMMWFAREEFDREACFHAVGGVRGSLEWEDFETMKLPIPNLDIQKSLVAEYRIIQHRITLNKQLIQKLEETAKAIYKEWFVTNSDPENLPTGWRMGRLEDLYQFQYGLGNNNPDNGGIYPVYGSNGKIGGYHEFNNEDAPVIGHIGANCGSVVFAWGKHFVTYNGVMCRVKEKNSKWFSYVTLLHNDLAAQTRGSSQPFVSYDMLYEIPLVIPNKEFMEKFNATAEKVFEFMRYLTQESQKLEELRKLLLAKMASA